MWNSRSRIVRNQEWDPALAKLNTLNLAELELSLLSLDAVDGETALGVVDETEVLAGLLNGDDIHEASGVGGVGADLAIDLDKALGDNGGDLPASKRVLQAIAEEDGEGEGLAQLMRTGRGTRSLSTSTDSSQCKSLDRIVLCIWIELTHVGTAQLVEHP